MGVSTITLRARLQRYGIIITIFSSTLFLSAVTFAEGLNPILSLPPAPEDVPTPTPASPTLTLPTPTPPPGTGNSGTRNNVPYPTYPQVTPLPTTPTPEPPISNTPSKSPTGGYVEVSRESLREALSRLNLPLPLPAARIVVTKSQRKLELFSGQTLVKSYRVALGAQPVGHKQTQGDSRTPEGQFYICTRNASTSAFHIFLGLSYPALPDATRAVNNKAITWREYMIIRQRLASRGAPLWRTRLGGWVGIHGGTGATYAQKKVKERKSNDWTAGCIALTDKEIKEIYSATTLGTSVLVKP